MCGFNCVYHDLNYATMEDQWLIKRKTQNNYISPYKNEVASLFVFTDVTDFDNEQKFTSASNSSYYNYQLCIPKRQKVILLLILSGNTNLFLDLKQYYMQKLRNTFFY